MLKQRLMFLKRNGFDEMAENLAKAYRKNSLYLELLYQKQRYSDMLKHIMALPGREVQTNLLKYGYELITKEPKCVGDLIDFCVKCCTVGISNPGTDYKTKIESEKFAAIFVDNNYAHNQFLYRVYRVIPDHMSVDELNSLIEMSIRTGGDKLIELLEELKGKHVKYDNEQVLVYLNAFDRQNSEPNRNLKEAKKLLYIEMQLYPLIIKEADPEQLLGICCQFGEKKPSLWSDSLLKLCESNCEEKIIIEFLSQVDQLNTIPFLTVLKIFQSTKKHKLRVILPYIQSTFMKEQNLLHKANSQIEKHKQQIQENHDKIEKLTKQNYVIDRPICTRCNQNIEEQGHHFLCGHSFHLRCLGDSTNFCPNCKNSYEEIVQQKINRLQTSQNSQDAQSQISAAGGGFSYLLSQINSGVFSFEDQEVVKTQLDDAQKFLTQLQNE